MQHGMHGMAWHTMSILPQLPGCTAWQARPVQLVHDARLLAGSTDLRCLFLSTLLSADARACLPLKPATRGLIEPAANNTFC